jgi:hypothetical protein
MAQMKLGGEEYRDKARQIRMRLATLTTAEKRRWLKFWTGDESGIMWLTPDWIADDD